MKKVAMLFNLNKHQFDYETEFDSEYTIDSLYNVLSKQYQVLKIEADKEFNWINKLRDFDPELVFNICEGFNGPARESVYAAILEQYKFNYSGPDSTNLLICHNKFLSKNILKNDILVPKGYVISNVRELDNLKNINFPVIVKFNSEGSSLGMSKSSVVYNYDELKKQVYKLYENYDKKILIEQYIEGKDISMIYVEGIGALGPCEINCESIFYDYEMKSDKDDTVLINPIDGDYYDLKNIVMKIANILDIKGYAKLDFRLCNDKYYLIEVNSQVSFHPEGEFITCAKKDGYSFDKIINHIVSYAINSEKKENSIGWCINNE